MRGWRPPRPRGPRRPGTGPVPRGRPNRKQWTAAFATMFPPWLRERGAAYLAEGAVKLVDVSEHRVRALVRGTDPYPVEVRRDTRGLGLSCECPYFQRDAGPCKHLWAVLLAAEREGTFVPPETAKTVPMDPEVEEAIAAADEIEDLDDDDEDVDPEFADGDDDWLRDLDDILPRSRPRTPPSRLSPARLPPSRVSPPLPAPSRPRHAAATPRWEEALAEIARTPERAERSWAPEREVVYVIEPSAASAERGLAVALASRQRTAGGGWTKPTPLRLRATLASSLPDAADRAIGSLLLGALGGYETPYDAYTGNVLTLRGELARIAVPMMLGTGRGFVRASPGEPASPLAWDDGGPWELWLTVTEDRSDFLVTGSLRREGESCVLDEPLVLSASGLVVFRDRAARLDDGGAFAWVSALRGGPVLRVPRGEAEALLAALTRATSRPRAEMPEGLSLEPFALAPVPRLRLSRPAVHYLTRLGCELSFDYGGRVVTAGEAGWAVLRAEEPRVVARDRAAETAAADRLRSLGVRTIIGYRGEEPRLELTPTHFPRVGAALMAEGWLLEVDGSLHRPAGRLRLEVRSGIDWFDLKGAAEFGDRSVPIAALADAISEGSPTVDLGDGSLGVIPEEWKRRLALVSAGTASQGGAVRFGRGQAALLDALLEAQPEVDVDARFAEVRARLHAFAGVRPERAPAGFQGDLRGYQQEGLGWMRFLREFGFGGILADDMGLGKTVQLLALLESRRAEGAGRPSLVVVPKSLVFNWKEEAARFAPGLRVLDHTGLGRRRDAGGFSGCDVVLTTYGVLRRDVAALREVSFDYVVLDEAQAVKNPSTGSAKAARLLSAAHRLALSGTPVENHVGELASILEFANPGLLGHTRAFRRGGDLGPEGRALLARTIRPFVLRRTKDQVAVDLPPRTEQAVHCRLDRAQRRFYDELRDRYRQSVMGRVARDGIARSKMHVLEALLRLRQAACHPGLVDAGRGGAESAKLDTLIPRLVELRGEGHKAIVYSQFTRLLALVEPLLRAHSIPYAYLDGRTRDRAAPVRRFQEDADCAVFLASLKAGGLGLNLTAASYVFVLDPWWNPAVEAQAIDRAHRIGQSRAVFAYRLIAEDTVEEKILELQESKRDLARALITEDQGVIGRLSREDLELLLS